MAKTIFDAIRVVNLVGALVSLQSRGRSFIDGTILVGDEVKAFSHELSEEEKSSLRELIAKALISRYPV